MRVYDVERESVNSFVVRIDGALSAFESESAQDAWKRAEKLAKNYARVKGLTAVYTTHPEGTARAAWVVK